MAVDVVTFFSEADLRDKKICVLGKTFASFEDFYLDDNKSFIRKDLIYCAPTVVLSEFAGSFRVEIVYCPNPFQHADPEFMSHMKSNIETLNSVKSFLWPLGTVLYRMKKGSMYAWGWCKERTSAWFLRHYVFKSPPKDEVEFSDKMTSVVESHYKLFSKLCPFFLSPLLEFCEEHSIKSMTGAIGYGNFTTTFDFASAQHFDNDFSWACGFWYNVLSEKKPADMRNGVPTQMGGHFFVPSLRCAFRLDAESTFLCWHSARHLHGTTLSSFFKKVLTLICLHLLLVKPYSFSDPHWHLYATHTEACAC